MEGEMGGLEPRPNRLIEPISMEITGPDFGDGTIEAVKAYKGLSSSNLLEKIKLFLHTQFHLCKRRVLYWDGWSQDSNTRVHSHRHVLSHSFLYETSGITHCYSGASLDHAAVCSSQDEETNTCPIIRVSSGTWLHLEHIHPKLIGTINTVIYIWQRWQIIQFQWNGRLLAPLICN